MKTLSIFDVIGPNMVGPSSSHTAGAAAIGYIAGRMCQEKIVRVNFTLYGSFARVYRGHGTDRALLGGVLGFNTDDLRIRRAFEEADARGVEYHYTFDTEEIPEHPNTADIEIFGEKGHHLTVRGVSLGGGKVMITRINGIRVEFTGEYSTLIVRQQDRPGVVTHITQCLSDRDVNIAFMRLFRESKGGIAYTVVESDERIPEDIIAWIRKNPNVQYTLLIQPLDV